MPAGPIARRRGTVAHTERPRVVAGRRRTGVRRMTCPGLLRHPGGRVHGEAGVRPGAQAGGVMLVDELEAHEEPEHGAAERLSEPRRVVHRPRD